MSYITPMCRRVEYLVQWCALEVGIVSFSSSEWREAWHWKRKRSIYNTHFVPSPRGKDSIIFLHRIKKSKAMRQICSRIGSGAFRILTLSPPLVCILYISQVNCGIRDSVVDDSIYGNRH